MNSLQKYEKCFYAIILIGTLIYFPIFFNGFVWDDYGNILNNPQVHQINISALFGPSVLNTGPFYRPLSATYFAFIYQLAGTHAFLYHLVQLMLHLTCTLLLFLFFRLFFRKDISFFLALIFLVHPINVESVAEISQAESELFFLPSIVAILLASKKELTRNRFLVIIALLCLSIFTKEAGFLFIPLIPLYRYLFKLGRVKEFLFSGIGIVVFYVLIRFFTGNIASSEGSDFAIASLPFLTRLINIPAIIVYYLITFFFPLNLTIWQTWIITTITPQSFFLPLFVCLVVAILVVGEGILLREHDKKIYSNRLQQYLFFSIWFVLGLGITLQIIPLDMTVADRWFYFPMVGILGMLGVILEQFLPSIKQHYKTYLYIAIAIIGLLSLRTFIRTFDWKSNATIYADARHQSNNYMLDNAYAVQLFNTGKINEAIEYDKRSISTFPTLEGITTLGEIYQKSESCDEAIPIFERALTYYKASAQKNELISQEDNALSTTYSDLANCYIQVDQPQDAINLIMDKALKRFPTSSLFYTILAYAYSENGENDQAIKAITKAYSLNPNPTVTEIYNRFKDGETPSFQ